MELLQNLLARERPRAIELHHMVGHDPAVLGLLVFLEERRFAWWFIASVALLPAVRSTVAARLGMGMFNVAVSVTQAHAGAAAVGRNLGRDRSPHDQ